MGSKTRGIFSAVGEEEGRGDFDVWEGRSVGVGVSETVDVGAAPLSPSPVQPDSRAHTSEVMTKDHVAARCTSMHRC